MPLLFDTKRQLILLQRGRKHIPLATITHLEASRNYTFIHTLQGRAVLSSYSLKHFMGLQEVGKFLRTSQSFMVNIQHINAFSDEGIMLRNDKQIGVSRRFKRQVSAVLVERR
jgi:DNA-binding LytR/AlgR family response regulator